MDAQIKNDGMVEISVAVTAQSKTWTNKKVQWSEMLRKLSAPTVTRETHDQFMAASKQEQNSIKDVGGFVGGRLLNGRRTKDAVQYRTLLTLDIDFSTNDFWWDFTLMYGCAACIHATHKSTDANPRHRLIIPLSREVTPEEYEPIARRVASILNINLFDQSTYEPNRLMYWPSVPCDVPYYFEYQDGPFLDADEVLATYSDWRDVSEWPVASTYDDEARSAVAKQEDPCAKKGLIGAFCRTYTIQDAIETFLSDIYLPAGDGRYTYALGSTAGGLVVYDDKFAYSHHGTDPCGGKLCNAYDLVRIQLYGHYDKGDKGRQSEGMMEQLILKDKNTMRTLGEEKLEAAKYDFSSPASADPDDEETTEEEVVDTAWTENLEANSKGEYESSAQNINLILKNDSVLKNAFVKNSFDNRRYITRSLPWHRLDSEGEYEPMRDVDYSGVRNYIECVYGITSSMKIDDSMSIDIERRSIHPVREYLSSLKWDGVKRVDTLLIDYFGAKDSEYTRATIRKALCAAVARIFRPGTKYDMVPILVGPQGTYKSTFLRKLGRSWFSDTFTTMAGREAYEQLQGSWIIELAELSAFKKSESEGIKQFISKCDDMFRPAYGRTVEVYKRQCVFFGTTNDQDFLKDPTGNRRFNPIDVRVNYVTKSVNGDMTDSEVDQIWAEAVELWKNGETLYFNLAEARQATKAQKAHSASDERVGVIEEFLNLKLPANWYQMDIYDRRTWLDNPLREAGTITREFVSVAEIWCECLHKGKEDMSRYNTRELNDIVRTIQGWEFMASPRYFELYGKQKYYQRRQPVNEYDDLF